MVHRRILQKGRGALQEKCKSTAPAVARGVMGLGKCVGFSTATQENSGRIPGRAGRSTLLGRTDSHIGGFSVQITDGRFTACNAMCWRGNAIGCVEVGEWGVWSHVGPNVAKSPVPCLSWFSGECCQRHPSQSGAQAKSCRSYCSHKLCIGPRMNRPARTSRPSS